MTLVVIISLLVGLSVASPPTLTICGRRNPNFDECVKNGVLKMIPHLREGIPEWHVPQLEPMYMPEVIIMNDETIKAKATEVYVRGLTYFDITYLKIDMKNNKIVLSVVFPKVVLDGQLNLSAQILVPIVGQGTMHSSNEGVTANTELKFENVDRKGDTYIHFSEITLKLDIENNNSSFKMSNDPGGVMENAINSVIRTEDGKIPRPVLKMIEKKISELIIELANNMCRHIPREQLMPDHE